LNLKSVDLIEEKGINYRLIELTKRAVTVKDVIKYSKSNLDHEEICKTILVKGPSRRYYAILLLGKDMIDSSKLKSVIGKFRIATLDEVYEVTGKGPGEVCPITLTTPLLVDKKVIAKSRINFGSGDKLIGLEIWSKDLEKLVDYSLIDVAK
jgi:prolyl-tRNA editing enzyme YbaK/EbsC (Cys-tRNA(Pro) deacylase)